MQLQSMTGLHCRNAPSYDEEPALFAVDCEMCATATEDKALLSLCLVDVNGDIALQVCWLFRDKFVIVPQA